MVAQMPADIASSAGVSNGIVSSCFVAVQHTYEAAFHGKPVVSVPIMNEQPDNAAKASCATPSTPSTPSYSLPCLPALQLSKHMHTASAGGVFMFSAQFNGCTDAC